MISKLFAQTDPRWSKTLLGNNADKSFTIGRYGCVVTAYANMLAAITGDMQFTPAMVNAFMKQHKGFPEDSGLFIWSAALALGHVEAHGTTTSLRATNIWLESPRNFAVLEVKLPGNHQHFVMAPYVNKIVDSQDGLLKSMGVYPFANAHLYSSTAPISAPPVPVPEVARSKSGTVAVTARPFLNLRTGPGTNFPIGKGLDGNGHTIYSLPTGAFVEYVDVKEADPRSADKGPWLVSRRGNYFAASGTNYHS